MNYRPRVKLSFWLPADELLDGLQGLDQEAQFEFRDNVIALVAHDDPDVREEALRVLGVRWKDAAARNPALAALRNDPEEAVRATAAYALAALTPAMRDEEVTHQLVVTVENESERPHVRGAAYEALLIPNRHPVFSPMNREFNPAVDIDWSWLRGLL